MAAASTNVSFTNNAQVMLYFQLLLGVLFSVTDRNVAFTANVRVVAECVVVVVIIIVVVGIVVVVVFYILILV